MYTDSHAHITCDELYENIEAVLENMKDVSRLMIMCTSPKELERALEIKAKDPDRFKVAFGWFPEEAKEMSMDKIQFLKDQLEAGNLDVLGEIGLDYHWDTTYKEEQKALFIKQLELANAYGLPVSIHMRDATKDTMDILKEYARTRIIFHCFSGSAQTMKEALKLDSLISFAGPVTFKNARNALECAAQCPKERILSETDSPYLTPHPFRGKRNEPKYVSLVCEKLAQIQEIPLEQMAEQIEKNFDSLFI